MNPATFLHVVASVNPSVGGPHAQSVPRLVRSLAELGNSVRLLCLDYPEHGPLPELPPGVLRAIPTNVLTRPLRGWSPTLARAIRQESSGAGIIHNHGLWMEPNHYAAAIAAHHRIPLVISPRGMLGSWALGHSAFRKKILWHLRTAAEIHSAAAFHATSQEESEDIRRAGFQQPIAILPNGVALSTNTPRERDWLHSIRPEFKGKRLALFLSRLHPKKGADELLIAWGRLDPSIREGWQLVVAGADLTGYLPTLEKLRNRDPQPESISFTGEVTGEFKDALLHHADFLVLPTKEENFGIVVAEALASGTPVITTHAAPWQALETYQCGWWIPGTQDALVNSLITAMACSPDSLQSRGNKGRDYVTRELDWRSIAKRMTDFYSWIAGRAGQPGFVRID